MAEASTQLVKYVFVDVVGFTQNRSVEAQVDIVNALNSIVRKSVESAGIYRESAVFLPTGDGVCIASLVVAPPFDVHLTIALSILELLHQHNSATQNEMRRFEVRIGINENVDNIVTDINGSRNVAGAGISTAQRVMSVADGGQIIAGPVVFETLRHRERYMKSFRPLQARVKHGVVTPVFQFIEGGHAGLNVGLPATFVVKAQPEHRLSEFEAYYLAFGLANREVIGSYKGKGSANYAAKVMLWMLAQDAESEAHRPDYDDPVLRVFGKGTVTGKELFDYYLEQDFWLSAKFGDFVEKELASLAPLLDGSDRSLFHVVNDKGKAKLLKEWPAICVAMGIA